MRKLLVVIATIAMLGTTSCGNKQIIDMTYTYDRVIISLPNGEVVEGKVESWRDYDDGDQLQIGVNGKLYLVHSMNVALIKD
jgi:hypothetical protein